MNEEISFPDWLHALLREFKKHHGAEYGLRKVGYFGS